MRLEMSTSYLYKCYNLHTVYIKVKKTRRIHVHFYVWHVDVLKL